MFFPVSLLEVGELVNLVPLKTCARVAKHLFIVQMEETLDFLPIFFTLHY